MSEAEFRNSCLLLSASAFLCGEYIRHIWRTNFHKEKKKTLTFSRGLVLLTTYEVTDFTLLQIPEILSPSPASYDKISLLWLLAKFCRKNFFFEIFNFSKNFDFSKISKKIFFRQNFARSHRSEILSYEAPMVLKISGICNTFSLQ